MLDTILTTQKWPKNAIFRVKNGPRSLKNRENTEYAREAREIFAFLGCFYVILGGQAILCLILLWSDHFVLDTPGVLTSGPKIGPT